MSRVGKHSPVLPQTGGEGRRQEMTGRWRRWGGVFLAFSRLPWCRSAVTHQACTGNMGANEPTFCCLFCRLGLKGKPSWSRLPSVWSVGDCFRLLPTPSGASLCGVGSIAIPALFRVRAQRSISNNASVLRKWETSTASIIWGRMQRVGAGGSPENVQFRPNTVLRFGGMNV